MCQGPQCQAYFTVIKILVSEDSFNQTLRLLEVVWRCGVRADRDRESMDGVRAKGTNKVWGWTGWTRFLKSKMKFHKVFVLIFTKLLKCFILIWQELEQKGTDFKTSRQFILTNFPSRETRKLTNKQRTGYREHQSGNTGTWKNNLTIHV